MASIPLHGPKSKGGLLGSLVASLRRAPADPPDSTSIDTAAAAPSGPVRDGARTRVLTLSGDLTDGQAVREFHQLCEKLVQPGRRRVVLDLRRVSHADTKLVASLVVVLRRAQAAGVTFELHVSPHVGEWIALCQVGRLLRPQRPARTRARRVPRGSRTREWLDGCARSCSPFGEAKAQPTH